MKDTNVASFVSTKSLTNSYKIESNPDYVEVLEIMRKKRKFIIKLKGFPTSTPAPGENFSWSLYSYHNHTIIIIEHIVKQIKSLFFWGHLRLTSSWAFSRQGAISLTRRIPRLVWRKEFGCGEELDLSSVTNSPTFLCPRELCTFPQRSSFSSPSHSSTFFSLFFSIVQCPSWAIWSLSSGHPLHFKGQQCWLTRRAEDRK